MKKLLFSLIAFSMIAYGNQNMFLEISGGKSQIDILNYVPNGILLNQALEANADLVDLGVGRSGDCYFVTLNYQYTDLPFVDIQNIYMSVNLQKEGANPKPYVGLLVGKSFLEWDTAPIANALSSDPKSSDFFIGYQAGGIYKIFQNVSIFVNMQKMNYVHTTKIDNFNFEYKNQTNINIGVRYDF